MGLTEYWHRMDIDGNGTVSADEFRKGVHCICPDLTHGEVIASGVSIALML